MKRILALLLGALLLLAAAARETDWYAGHAALALLQFTALRISAEAEPVATRSRMRSATPLAPCRCKKQRKKCEAGCPKSARVQFDCKDEDGELVVPPVPRARGCEAAGRSSAQSWR